MTLDVFSDSATDTHAANDNNHFIAVSSISGKC